MPKPTRGPRLGNSPAHERLMLANMAAHLFAAEGLTTTVSRAKRLRPFAEKLITRAKKGGVHNQRVVVSRLRDKETAAKLFAEIAPRFEDRDGGYLRILKLGPRKGDGAPMARIELVE